MLMVSRGVGVLLFAWLFVSGGVAAQLDPEVLVDRYLVRVEGLIAEQNYTAALEVLDDVFSIQQENNFTPPDEFHFVYAQVALSAGSIPVAIESVTRYLTVAGQSGEFYTEALELWDRAEAEADRRARVELEAQARREAERRQAELEAERRRQAALEAERRRQAALEAERRRQAALGPAVALLGVERDEARVLATRCPRLRIVSDLKRAHFLLFKTFSLWLSHDSRGRSLGLIPTARQTESIDRICERLPQSSEGLVTVAEGNGTAEESRTERSGDARCRSFS